MLNRLGFYNHFGNGDIFESREFVRELMTHFSAKEYIYYTGKSSRLTKDIPNLKATTNFPEFLTADRAYVSKDNELYINTWIGRDSKYVYPGIGCTVEKLYEMYNNLLCELSVSTRLTQPILNYLTDFDFSCFEVGLIDTVFEARPKDKKLIYVSNGSVCSSQAENFLMSPLIAQLALRFTNAIFFITQPDANLTLNYPNIRNANEFAVGMETNLPELSYLSQFCDILIGRNSGPHVFAWTKHNCMRDILNITLTKNVHCSHFVHHTPIVMRTAWSSETETTELVTLISELIDKEL